jgi:hypothetical protein
VSFRGGSPSKTGGSKRANGEGSGSSKEDVILQEAVKLSQSLIELGNANGPMLFDKSLQEVCRNIEKQLKVEKCFIISSEGKTLTDKKDVTIPIKECKAVENVVDTMSAVIMNDTKNDKVVNKEVFRFFSVKPFNLMLQPVIQRK